jgi:mono/diheme cytochrome c family protein
MKQTTPGGEVFRTYCATCHGTSARGDGPLAASMKRKPANLTEIAKRNGGEFPTELVFKTIDGRQPVRGHGGPDMPVWGDAFSRSREAGDQERVKAVIQSLVEYLGSIQLRQAHEQQ